MEPPCDIFEECGGCQWQHFNYPRQLQTKRQFVVDALKRIGRLDNVTVQPCLPSPTPFVYRNKAMPVLSMREGHFVSGIYEPRSHHLVPYHTCPIQGDAINDFIQKVLKKIDRSGLTPYQEKRHTGFLRHLAVRQGVKTGELLLAFVTRTEVPEERVQKASLMPERSPSAVSFWFSSQALSVILALDSDGGQGAQRVGILGLQLRTRSNVSAAVSRSSNFQQARPRFSSASTQSLRFFRQVSKLSTAPANSPRCNCRKPSGTQRLQNPA